LLRFQNFTPTTFKQLSLLLYIFYRMAQVQNVVLFSVQVLLLYLNFVNAEENACFRQQFQSACSGGNKLRIALRYYVKDGRCVAYPASLCEGANEQKLDLFKTAAECERRCLNSNLADDDSQQTPAPSKASSTSSSSEVSKEIPKVTKHVDIIRIRKIGRPTVPTVATVQPLLTSAPISNKFSSQCSVAYDAGHCKNETQRWYFDFQLSKCKTFTYSGCGGNENNYRTEEECEISCKEHHQPVCPKRTSPLVDTNGNLFDCFLQSCPNDFKCIYTSEKAYCCPDILNNEVASNLKTRPALCEQRKERGFCDLFELRFYYDVQLEECNYFFYGGCGGNQNNFKRLSDCKQTCGGRKDSTTRWNQKQIAEKLIQLETTQGGEEEQKQQQQKSSEKKPELKQSRIVQDRDPDLIVVNTVSSVTVKPAQQIVQTSFADRIEYGTRKPSTENSEDNKFQRCSQPAVKGHCSRRLRRWFWDARKNQCVQFIYSGCGGNGNNFLTEKHCTDVCADPCMLPKKVGRCRGAFQRWYYDSSANKCRKFIYGGCDANENNFVGEEECISACVRGDSNSDTIGIDETDDNDYETTDYTDEESKNTELVQRLKTAVSLPAMKVNNNEDLFHPVPMGCLQPVETGNCDGVDVRWHYNKANHKCEAFVYTGCNGNDNNFASQLECVNVCIERLPLNVCHHPVDKGTCKESYNRWYYDRPKGACKQFSYSGCGGNGNNFANEKECLKMCNAQSEIDYPASDDICYRPLDVGFCNDEFIRWYYDPSIGDCKLFIFTGCGGNANSFSSSQECRRRCVRGQKSETPTVPNVLQQVVHKSDQFKETTAKSDDLSTTESISELEESWNTTRSESEQETPDERDSKGDGQAVVHAIIDKITKELKENQTASTVGDLEETLVDLVAEGNTSVDLNTRDGRTIRLDKDSLTKICKQLARRIKVDMNDEILQASREHSIPLVPVYTGENGQHSEGQMPGSAIVFAMINDERDPLAKCLDELHPGRCSNYVERWYYDRGTKKCRSFQYGGCGGNRNHFYSKENCIFHCERIADEVEKEYEERKQAREDYDSEPEDIASPTSAPGYIPPGEKLTDSLSKDKDSTRTKSTPIDENDRNSDNTESKKTKSKSALESSEKQANLKAPGFEPKNVFSGYKITPEPDVQQGPTKSLPQPPPLLHIMAPPTFPEQEIRYIPGELMQQEQQLYNNGHFPPPTISNSEFESSPPYATPPISVMHSSPPPYPTAQVPYLQSVAPTSAPLLSVEPYGVASGRHHYNSRLPPPCASGEVPVKNHDGSFLHCLPGQMTCPPDTSCYYNGLDYYCCSQAPDQSVKQYMPSTAKPY
ncbi:Papilin, partial [Trichinella papuae]